MEPLGITTQTLYCQNLESLRYIVVADSLVYLHSEKHTCFERECEMALQGHPSSLILAPIESTYVTSYWSSIVTLVLFCPVSEIADFAAPRSEDPKLIIRVINFELVRPICPAYINVPDRQTDGETDGRTDDIR